MEGGSSWKGSLSFHLSLNREGRWGTTDDFATSSLHLSLFSTALWDLANSRPVHSLMLSSHLFFCLPCLLSPPPPFTVLWKMEGLDLLLLYEIHLHNPNTLLPTLSLYTYLARAITIIIIIIIIIKRTSRAPHLVWARSASQ